MKEEPKQETNLKKHLDSCEEYQGPRRSAIVDKQETLEEAAERLFKEYSNNTSLAEGHYDYMMDKDDFKEAFLEIAKWQQEKSYSEEDMKNAFDSARKFNSLDGVVDVHIVLPMGGDMSDLQPLHSTFKEWLEQFKNKQNCLQIK